MIKSLRLIAVVSNLLIAFNLSAQIQQQNNFNNKFSVPGACLDKTCNTNTPKVGSFTNAYTQTQCGLNYAIGGVKLTQRATWQPGVGQPATINISSIPPCVVPAQGHILRAYVYWIVEGGPATGSVNLTNPLGITQNFNGTLIGNISGGKCWSCSHTRHFRADVTSHITGNGNYQISGLPTSTICGDTDGAVLVIIYRDPAATYQGTIVLHDGIILVNGGAQNHTLSGFTACGPTSNASAFTVTGDLQNNVWGPHYITMNGVTNTVTPNFFNVDIRNVTVSSGQSTSQFGVSVSDDCWSWICAGLYFQTTTCVVCTPSGTLATPGPVSGPTTVCQGQSATYSIGPVTGATSYNWTVPAGWTINLGQGTTSINVTAGASPGNVCVTASNSCGVSSPSCTSVTINTAPASPGPISGNASVCGGQSLTYSISNVSGATSYNWTVPAGWTINSGQGTTSINVTTTSSTGNICVTASNSCGTSAATCLAVTVGSAPAMPGAITGANPVCPGTSNTYSISSVAGATSYTWTVPSGWTINSGQGTTTISTTSGSSGGNICVTASNGCGTSTAQCVNITMNSNSTAPTSISATTNPTCGGATTLSVVGGSLGTGATWNWYSGSCGGIFVGTGASITVTPSTTTTYFVRAEGACGNTTCASITITVNTNSTAPTSISATTNPTCGGSTTLSVLGGSLGTGATWNWYSGSCGGTFVGTGASITVTPSTTTTYFVRAQGACGNTSCASITITVNTNSTAPTSISATTNPTCGGATTLSVVGGTLGTGASWNWYSGSCGGTFVGTGASITVTPSTTTTYFVRAQGACGNTSCASITITVNTNSTAPTSISATTNPTCGGATTLSVVGGSLGTGASWNWYSGSCGGTLVGTGNSITVTPGSTTTYFVQAVGTCNTTPCTQNTITVNSPSTAPTSATANPSVICVGNATTLTVNGGNLGSGAQWQWYSGSCGGTAVGTGSSITVSPTNTTTYFVRAVGTCNTTTCVSVTVTVDQNPATSNAGPNQSICGLTATLAGNTPSLGSGTWSQISGPGTITFSNINSPSSTATASTYGTYVLQWTINNGSCSTSSNVSITFDEMPIPSAAGSDAAVCGLTVNLTGNTPNVGIGTWSMQSGPGTITFGNSSSSTTTATASVYGTYTLTWTFTNGSCSNSDNVDITFDEMPIPSAAGSDAAVCGLTVNLNGNTPNVGIGTWSMQSGPGTITFGNSSSSTTTATASVYGTYTLTWTFTNGSCSNSDNVDITFDEMPNIGSLSPTQNICGLTGTLNGITPNIGTGTWSQASGPGVLNFGNLNSPNTSVIASVSGLYTLTWTFVNGACSASNNTDVEFFDAPTPVNAGVDTAVCALSLNLNAQNPNVGIGTWTQITGPVNGTFSNSNSVNSQFDVTQYGNYTLVWTVVNGVCTLSDTVNIRFDENPSIAVAGFDTTICTNDYLLVANTPIIGNGIWTTTASGIVMSDSTANINYLSSLNVGINTLIWTISNGVCPTSSDTVEIIVNPSSIIPDFKTDTTEIYAYQIVAFIDLSTGNPNSWHWNFGDGDTSSIQNPGHIYTDIGIYPVMLVITNALGCRDTIIKDIEVKERFLVPNVFTPNNDGINDVFKVIASGYKDFSMQIYNRFGQVIFESFNPTIGWNGKTAAGLDVTVGTYFYIIKAVAPDGKEVIEKGPLQLLR